MATENHLKITDTAILPDGLERGKNYRITAEANCFGANIDDDFEGGEKIVWKLRINFVDIVTDNGKTVRAVKGKKSKSQSMRGRINIFQHSDGFADHDDEEFYQACMSAMIEYFPEIFKQFIANKLKKTNV